MADEFSKKDNKILIQNTRLTKDGNIDNCSRRISSSYRNMNSTGKIIKDLNCLHHNGKLFAKTENHKICLKLNLLHFDDDRIYDSEFMNEILCKKLKNSSDSEKTKYSNSNNTKTNKLCRCKINWQHFLVFIIIFLLNISTINCLAARQEGSSGCLFPKRWEGSWFQSGVPQTIDIQGSFLSNRGRCIASDGDKFLLVNEKRCHRCVVIYEKHKNVLQYKESECEDMYSDQLKPAAMPMRSSIIKSDHNRGGAHPNMNGHSRLSSSDLFLRSNDDTDDCMGCKGKETLQFLCEQIPGDALLYSMFKIDAEPIKCPIKGPFSFTYNRGHGECKNPVSSIKSCTEESRMLLNFQACPDVSGTESTVEELTCLAAWKDGNARYLVGLVTHNHATSNEERFRCFVYEKINSNTGKYGISSKDAEYKLAQSGDATCNGLESAEVGSRIMTLRKAPPTVRCDFPSWFKGPKHWHALSGNTAYIFHQNDGSMHIVKQNGYLETRFLCEQINKQTQTEMMAVVHYTSGCKSGFICMMFYRRDTYVAELQIGREANRLEDSCAPDYFDMTQLPYITLLASNPESEVCPLSGSYSIKGLIGPPFMSSRHKRNHGSNKHISHHHHEITSNPVYSKRHITMSFRNGEDSEQILHLHGRFKSLRQRRSSNYNEHEDASNSQVFEEMPGDDSDVTYIDETNVIKISRRKRSEDNESSFKDNRENVEIVESTDLELSTNLYDEMTRNRRDISKCVVNVNAHRTLSIGCSSEDVIEVDPQCSDEGDEEYTCHGSWRENQTTFIIGRHKESRHGVCISFKSSLTDPTVAQLIVGDTCYREHQSPEIPDHHLMANLTHVGRKCGDRSASSKLSNNWVVITLLSWTSIFFIFR